MTAPSDRRRESLKDSGRACREGDLRIDYATLRHGTAYHQTNF